MVQHTKPAIAVQMCSPDVAQEPHALRGPPPSVGSLGPTSLPSLLFTHLDPLGKGQLGVCLWVVQEGREVRRDEGKGAWGTMALRAGRLRGTAAPQCYPLQLFPIAHCRSSGWKRRGRCPLTSLGKMQWRSCSTPWSDLPAGQRKPGTDHVHVSWSLGLLLTSAQVPPWLMATASDGAATCHYQHSGYNYHLLLFFFTERRNHHKY